MNMKSRIITHCLLLLAFIGSSLTLNHDHDDVKHRMDRLVQHVMNCGNITTLGLSIVSQKQGLSYDHTYGTLHRGVFANRDTRFCIGGATEAFTAVLMAKLIDENENVTWNTPIQEIIGRKIPMPDDYRASHLNLVDIFTQRSGLPGMDIVPVVGPFSTSRMLSNLRYTEEVTSFRQKYIPNHILFALLEEVFQVLGGDSWEGLLHRHIFRPLDMTSVKFLGRDGNEANLTYPYVSFSGKTRPLSLEIFKGLNLIKTAASMCLSVGDFNKWTRFLFDGKDHNNRPVMHWEVLEKTFKGIQPRDNDDKDPQLVGYRQPDVHVSYTRELNALGWITGHYRGHGFVSQDGSIPGYQALATYVPSRKVAVFVAFNGDGGGKGLAAKVLLNMFALDLVMQDNTWFNETDVCRHFDQMMKLHPREEGKMYHDIIRTQDYSGQRPLTDFVGHYRNYAYGDVHVKYDEEVDAELQMEYGHVKYKMMPTNSNTTFQLFARGLYSYTTTADTYRKNRLIAVFSDDGSDPSNEHRFTTLTVDNFDKNGHVVFSTHPTIPNIARSRDDHEHHHCGAAMNSAVSLLSLLLLSVLNFLR